MQCRVLRRWWLQGWRGPASERALSTAVFDLGPPNTLTLVPPVGRPILRPQKGVYGMAEIVHHGPACSWRQSGNKTGHCSGCCRTFDTLSAFETHQTVVDGKVICRDPATMTRPSDGSPLYTSRADDVTTYWALVPTEAQVAAHARFMASVRRDRQ